jgi:hypothetical protein
MKFTIVNDATNEILRQEHLDNDIVDRAVSLDEDVDAIKSDFLQQVVSDGETAYEGNFVATAYDFNGFDFVENIKFQYQPPVLREPTELLMMIVKQLDEAGHPLRLHVDKIVTRNDAYKLVNLAVSEALERYISAGKLTTMIYTHKEQAVKEWRAAGSVEADAPELVMSWYENASFDSIEDAAQNIEAQALQMITAIEMVERSRLSARKAILKATGDFQTVIAPFLKELDNI